ncbi:MAG: metallophosphoesterase family protein [Candidatus Omnitrophica bacterium]|nr:metallophosphoesterase family protein [Candidatus Omnitrophota bacterium]MDE2222646.1 metallophosphoesterase family protein [Candidatus Omnitrophota bacterium]
MTIGVLSDTHSLNIPAALIERFKTVDLIIHAGDICDLDTLKMLKKLKPTKAVSGNMDENGLKKVLPVKEIIDCDNLKIGVTHGHVGPGPDALKNAMTCFKDDKMDVVIFGHSHQALNQRVGLTLYFNPGSPNDMVRAKFFSYGLISIEAGKIKAEIVKI